MVFVLFARLGLTLWVSITQRGLSGMRQETKRNIELIAEYYRFRKWGDPNRLYVNREWLDGDIERDAGKREKVGSCQKNTKPND